MKAKSIARTALACLLLGMVALFVQAQDRKTAQHTPDTPTLRTAPTPRTRPTSPPRRRGSGWSRNAHFAAGGAPAPAAVPGPGTELSAHRRSPPP